MKGQSGPASAPAAKRYVRGKKEDLGPVKFGRAFRNILGVLNILPIAYGALFFWWASSMALHDNRRPTDIEKFNRQFEMIFSLHLAISVTVLVLIGVHIVYLFKTKRVPNDKKALWASVIFLGNMFAIPVFWYLYVRKPDDPRDNDTSNQAL